jgi:mRNA deadenylase 3'-5' endonuclease subunit Ccr4
MLPTLTPHTGDLELVEVLELPGVEELTIYRGLPNGFHPSDHLPLAVRFRLHRRDADAINIMSSNNS